LSITRGYQRVVYDLQPIQQSERGGSEWRWGRRNALDLVGTSIDAPSSVACDVKSFAMWTWIKAYQSSKNKHWWFDWMV
jgi:hypothetical protein